MKLSVGVANLGGKDYFENLELNHQVGFNHFDMGFPAPDSIVGLNADFDGFIKRVNEKKAALGIDFVQSHAPMGKPLRGDDDARRLIEVTKSNIRACHELGIPSVVVHSGYLPNITKEECFELNKKFFDELMIEAEKYGVYVLIENFNKMSKEDTYWIDNATDLLTMVELVDHPLCQIVWDAGHANLQEMPQHEELALLGDRVMATHIQDNMGDRDTHLNPFFGTMNMDDLMTGLINIGYKGAFNFETGPTFTAPHKRRPFDGEQRLYNVPRSVRMAAQKMLYEIGKATLEAYGQFED